MSLDPRSGDDRFRPDLEGLRGIAILLVLLCHVGIPGAEAGFVGVDVFFVLSGFLITGLLIEERERTGRIGLGRFYARRARRILPAAALVIASTLLAAQLVLSPLDVPRVADDALAAGLSLANVRFALDATEYFAPVDPSPLLHYWSLARRGAVLPPVARPAPGRRLAGASTARDGSGRARRAGRLVPPLLRDDRRLGNVGLLLPPDAGLAARRGRPAGPRRPVVQPHRTAGSPDRWAGWGWPCSVPASA